LISSMVSMKDSNEKAKAKIAFLFISHDHMPLEEIWREFFTWHVNSSDLYTIYVHKNQNLTVASENSFFHSKSAYSPMHVKWQHVSLIQGIRHLVQQALKDPSNEWFCTVTDSCVPLIPFTMWRNSLLRFNRSIINACNNQNLRVDAKHTWHEKYRSIGLQQEQWKQSEPLFAITRKHAELFANSSYLDSIFQSAATEHLIPSLLAMNHLEQETTCSDGFSAMSFIDRRDIRVYSGNDISPRLIDSFKVANGDTCSGVPDVCHFTARKFSSTAKYPLLENIGLLLGTKEDPYTGNPWKRFSSSLRRSANYSAFYLIDHGMLRKIPDNVTAYYMHLDLDDATAVTADDLEHYPYGHPIPTRRDGMIYESSKQRLIYLMRAGHRNAIPSMTIFKKLGLRIEDLLVISDYDLEQIAVGDFIPNVDHQQATVGH
jgi:hypothetical protein